MACASEDLSTVQGLWSSANARGLRNRSSWALIDEARDAVERSDVSADLALSDDRLHGRGLRFCLTGFATRCRRS